MGKWIKLDGDIESATNQANAHFKRKDGRNKTKVKGAEKAFLDGDRVEVTQSGGTPPENAL